MIENRDETKLREELAALGLSLFERGYAAGSGGNISCLIDEKTLLATPSGSSLGRLDPDELSKVDRKGNLISGRKASKEILFHRALYDAAPDCGAVVHLHSTYATMLSCLKELETGNPIRPFTPYFVMKIRKLMIIPYYPPGDPRIAEELGKRGGEGNGFLLQNHGPVVTAKSLSEAVDLAEELEETAKLFFLMQNSSIRYLTDEEISELRARG